MLGRSDGKAATLLPPSMSPRVAQRICLTSAEVEDQLLPRRTAGPSVVSRCFAATEPCLETNTTKAEVRRVRAMSPAMDAAPTVH